MNKPTGVFADDYKAFSEHAATFEVEIRTLEVNRALTSNGLEGVMKISEQERFLVPAIECVPPQSL